MEKADKAPLIPDLILSRARKEEFCTKSGHRVIVCNLGDPKLDVKLDPKKTSDFFDAIDNRQIEGENITVFFDNRSFGGVVKDSIREIRDHKESFSAVTAIVRLLGGGASAHPEDHLIYFNTQEFAFVEALGISLFGNIVKHEFAHLARPSLSNEEIIAKGRRNCFIGLGNLALFSAGLYYAFDLVVNKTKYYTDTKQVLLETGALILALGICNKLISLPYDRDNSEIKARMAEKIPIEVTRYKPEMMSVRLFKNSLKKYFK